ncbi:MAG TPA: DUF6448 family protein [Pseudobacteroides sp.]|uniref:DUF6448 family protein n=1 Tax=Pseudobacteroides sp. TaxID=1968840 RepID=UPI002F94907C
MNKIGKVIKIAGMSIAVLAASMLSGVVVNAHCDTVDGPVVSDAKKSIEDNNINYILKWVKPEGEKELTKAFELSMKVRSLSPEAQTLADNYLFENLVRIHRAGEGAPFTGVKPSGSPVDEKILAADKSIEARDMSPLEKFIPDDHKAELKERFEKVMSLKDFDVNDVEAGREYVEAYVAFFHLAEGEESGEKHGETGEAGHTKETEASQVKEIGESHKNEVDAENSYLQYVPWILSAVFLLTSILLGIPFFKKQSGSRQA